MKAWLASIQTSEFWYQLGNNVYREGRHGLAWFAYRAKRIRIFDGASSLSYATIVSLVAILVCSVTIYQNLLDEKGQEELISRIEQLIYPEMEVDTDKSDTTQGDRVQGANASQESSHEQFSVQRSWLSEVTKEVLEYNTSSLTLIGFAVLIVTGSSLMATLEGLLNTIWFVRKSRPIVMRLVVYWGAVSISPILLIVSTTITAKFEALPVVGGMVDYFPVGLRGVTTFIMTTAALTWIYKVLPNTYVPVFPAVIGGVTGGILWELAKYLFRLYVRHYAGGLPFYQMLGGLPLFLVWIYTGWLLVLIGALVTYGVQHWRALPWTSGGASRECIWTDEIVYRIMYVIAEDFQRRREAPEIDEIVSRVQIEEEQVRVIIERLVHAGFLRWAQDEKHRRRGLLPAQSINCLNLSEVFASIHDPYSISPWADRTAFANAVNALRDRRHLLAGDLTVENLFDSTSTRKDT